MTPTTEGHQLLKSISNHILSYRSHGTFHIVNVEGACHIPLSRHRRCCGSLARSYCRFRRRLESWKIRGQRRNLFLGGVVRILKYSSSLFQKLQQLLDFPSVASSTVFLYIFDCPANKACILFGAVLTTDVSTGATNWTSLVVRLALVPKGKWSKYNILRENFFGQQGNFVGGLFLVELMNFQSRRIRMRPA